MASIYSATSEGENALVADTQEGILWLMGVTTTTARIIEWGVSFDGVVATAQPIRVGLFRVTNAGTTPTATVEMAWDIGSPAAACIAAKGFATPPTFTSTPLCEYNVHPQSGLIVQYPLGREPTIDNVTTDGLGVYCTSNSVVNALATIIWEE